MKLVRITVQKENERYSFEVLVPDHIMHQIDNMVLNTVKNVLSIETIGEYDEKNIKETYKKVS